MPWEDALRLLAAIAAGAIIGFEREVHDKPAGLRTNILICLGAALFTVLSERMVGDAYSDRTRIAAQVVTGVGFLGAGAIIQARGGVIGLTTAATIWGVASVGMAFGFGQYLLGLIATILFAAVLFAISSAMEAFEYRRTTVRLSIRLGAFPEHVDALRKQFAHSGVLCRSWHITKSADGLTVQTTVAGPVRRVDRLHDTLLKDDRVISFERQ